MVSVIMPAYNAGKTIEYAINSIINQTFSEWELIVINDCSQDNTQEIVKKYAQRDKRIVLINNRENLRVAQTRNIGINNAQFKYLAFLDSDDAWHKEKLSHQIAKMEELNIAFSSTNYEIINEKGERVNKYVKSYTRTYKQLLRGNTIGTSTVIINKEMVKPFAFKTIGHEDYALWLNILKDNNIKVFKVDENLTYHRLGNVSLSSNKFKAMRWTWNVFRKEEKIHFFKSIYLFIIYAFKAVFKVKSL